MQEPDLFFVISACPLREVGETVEQYDEHFWRDGHSVRMIVFDDSSPANQEKYFPLPEQTKTHNNLFYGGPCEQDQFIAYLHIKRMAHRELKDREARQDELGYEARKRKLLAALRNKIAERQTKGK